MGRKKEIAFKCVRIFEKLLSMVLLYMGPFGSLGEAVNQFGAVTFDSAFID